MPQDQDPPEYNSIYSDFELLLTKIMTLPGKEERITLINLMACRIKAKKHILEASEEDQDLSKDIVHNDALCESSDVSRVRNHVQRSAKKMVHGCEKCPPALA